MPSVRGPKDRVVNSRTGRELNDFEKRLTGQAGRYEDARKIAASADLASFGIKDLARRAAESRLLRSLEEYGAPFVCNGFQYKSVRYGQTPELARRKAPQRMTDFEILKDRRRAEREERAEKQARKFEEGKI